MSLFVFNFRMIENIFFLLSGYYNRIRPFFQIQIWIPPYFSETDPTISIDPTNTTGSGSDKLLNQTS